MVFKRTLRLVNELAKARFVLKLIKRSDFSANVNVFDSIQEDLSRLFRPLCGLKNHDGFIQQIF